MKRHLDGLVRAALNDAIDAGQLPVHGIPAFALDAPADAAFGDVACNVAILLAREVRTPPHAVAETVIAHLDDPGGWFAGVDVAGPGYINFRFAPPFWRTVVEDLLVSGEGFGRSEIGRGRPVRIDVGWPADAQAPHHPRHGRAAAVGGVLVRLLGATGWAVEDAGAAEPAGDVTIGVHGLDPTSPRVLHVGPVRLTRRGIPLAAHAEAVPLGEVVDEIGPDAARFAFLLEAPDHPLDLDLELAKRQSADNAVFYVRYAHARLCAVVRQASEAGAATTAASDLARLGEAEVEPLRVVADFPDVVDAAARALQPQRIAAWAVRVAGAFHRYYNQHRVDVADPALAQARLAVVHCLRQTLRTALDLCGVSAPERM